MESKTLKIYIYILSVIRASFYTPVILSFAFFAIILTTSLSGSLQQNISKLVFMFFPDGKLNETDILSIYGKLAFALSLIISTAETFFRKTISTNPKKKMLVLLLLLFIGYSSTFVFFLTKTNNLSGSLPVFLAFFVISALAVFIDYKISKHINFLESAFTN